MNVNSVIVYPNPAKDQIIIEGKNEELKRLTIFNILGMEVNKQTSEIFRDETKAIFNISKLKPGNYFIKTQTSSIKLYVE